MLKALDDTQGPEESMLCSVSKTFQSRSFGSSDLQLLHGFAQLLWSLVGEVSLQVVFFSLVDPLLHLLHLLP